MENVDLLDIVQPATGWFAVLGIKGPRDVRQELVSTRREVDELAEQYAAEGRNVFFGVAKYATGDNRTKENVRALKAFWLDIDCGEVKAEVNPETGRPDGYINQAAGLQALKEFCSVVGLPKPTLVNSGGGLHVYWPLEEEITRAEWEPVAERFKDVCRTQNFYVDDKVFEVARILRIPGTYNFKEETPRPVSIIAVGKPTTLDDFRRILGVVDKPKRSIFDDNYEPSPRELAMYNGIGYSFKRIMQRTAKGDGCNQLLHAYKNRATISYYEWFYALSVAAMCEDADKAVHMMSDGYPDYDPETVESKVATIRKATSCAKFKSVNPEICEGCPHFGKIMGPKELGRQIKEATTDIVEVETEEGEVEAFTVPKYPKPYYRGDGGGIWWEPSKKAEDDEAMPVQVYEYDLYPVKIMDDSIEGNVVLFRLHLPHNNTKEFISPLKHVLDPTELRKVLSSKGVISTGKKQAHLLEFTALMLKDLQIKYKEQIMRQQFGWADNSSKFIIGSQEINVDGIAYSPPSKTTRPLAKFMGAVGSFERWKEIWALYNTPGLEPHAFAALSAFGSPLLRFLDQTGAVINLFNPRSGTGKTTILNMVNSVYGHPKEMRLKQNDTLNGRLQWVGILNNIPPTMDELTNMTPIEYSEFLYALSNGKGKERMQAGTNELRENNTTWQSITVSTSNSSFAEKLSVIKNNPEGELMRLIEYPINKVEALNTAGAKQMFDRDLLHNYGHAGVHFTRYVLENMERVQRRCDNLQEKIDRELGLEPKERFWSATTAANIAGGLVATECGIMDWDMDRIYLYACGLIDDLRRNGVTPVDDVRQTVADYLYRNIQNILVVNGEVDRRTHMQAAPLREPRGELLVRIEPDTKRMFIIAKSFKDYCVKFQINYLETVKKLETEGRIIEKKPIRLSKGTAISGEPIHCLWFKIDDEFVDTTQYAGTEVADAD
jgi:hypothetical protein